MKCVCARRCCAGTILIVLAGCISACTQTDHRDDQAIARDSAGVLIIETNAANVTTWTIEELPQLEIGVTDGAHPYLFDRIRTAFRLGDGRIVVADGGTCEIRYFDADGRHLHTLGGCGSGPAEFRVLTSISELPGDSLLVHDRRNGRLVVINHSGVVASTALTAGMPGLSQGDVVGRVEDGRLVVVTRIPFPLSGPGSYRRDSVVVSVAGSESATVDTAFQLPSTEYYVFDNAGTGMVGPAYDHPFGHVANVAVWDGRIVAGTADTYELRVADATGLLHSIVRRTDAAPIQLDGARLSHYLDQIRETADGKTASSLSTQMEWFPGDRNVPAYSTVLADDQGYLWVRDFSPRGLPRARGWSVFAPDGRMTARTIMPPGLQPFDIDAEHVVGRARDDMNVEYIRVHRLQRKY